MPSHENFIIPPPHLPALEQILGQMTWLHDHYPDCAWDIDQVDLVLRMWSEEGKPLPLTYDQATLLATPGLWGVHRGAYENFMALWKAQMFDRGILGMPVV